MNKRVRVIGTNGWPLRWFGQFGFVTHEGEYGASIRFDGSKDIVGNFLPNEYEIIEVDNKPLPLPG